FFYLRQLKFFKQLYFNFTDFHFDFIIIDARLVAGPFAPLGTLAASIARLSCDDVANLAVAVTGTDVFFLFVIVTNFIFIQGTDRDFDRMFSIRRNDAFLTDDVRKVFSNRFAYFFFMALLIFMTFSVKGPIAFRDDKLMLHNTPHFHTLFISIC